MKDIKRTSNSFLFSCFVFLLGSAAMLGLLLYMGYENLFIPPPGFENISEKSVAEATNLESLKKTCLFWAQNNDAKSELVDEALELFGSLLYAILYWTIFLSVFFGFGFLSINRKLRRYERAEQTTPQQAHADGPFHSLRE